MQRRGILDDFARLVEPLAAMFGSSCEVVLHDLTRPDESIIAIANDHVSGRKVGDPVADLQLYELAVQQPERDAVVGYRIKTRDGRSLRAMTFFIRDTQGDLIGALGINYDLTIPLLLQNFANTLCEDLTFEKDELFPGVHTDVDMMLQDLVQTAIRRTGKEVFQMDREDRIAVVRYLGERGAFLIRGAVNIVANELGVSRVMIYQYIDEAGVSTKRSD